MNNLSINVVSNSTSRILDFVDVLYLCSTAPTIRRGYPTYEEKSGTSEAELRNWPFYKSIDFAYLTQPIHLYIDTSPNEKMFYMNGQPNRMDSTFIYA